MVNAPLLETPKYRLDGALSHLHLLRLYGNGRGWDAVLLNPQSPAVAVRYVLGAPLTARH